MDEKFRESVVEVNEHLKKMVMEATDLNDVVKAMSAYKMSSEIILKYDQAVDSHDENVEKIMNAQANEEKKHELEAERLDNDISASETRIHLEKERIKNEKEASAERLEFEREKYEQEKEFNNDRIANEKEWRKKDNLKSWLMFAIPLGASALITAGVFLFDGKGVLFTSQAGKQLIPSVLKGMSNSLKL